MALNFEIDDILINAMIEAGGMGFKLGGRKVSCVGLGRMQPLSLSPVSGIIGIAGRVNGSILVNMSEAAALSVTNGMLMAEAENMNAEVLDGVAEVTNVIGGRMKSTLATSGYPLDNITLPSVIVGQGYFIQQSKGMLTHSVTFTLDDDKINRVTDRVIQVVLTVMANDLKANQKAA